MSQCVKELMGEINEADEVMDDQEEMLLSKIKDPKKRTLIKNDRTNFHSGEYYKDKELEKKFGENNSKEAAKESEGVNKSKLGKHDGANHV